MIKPWRYATILALNAVEFSAISLTYAAVPVVLRANGASLEAVGIFGVLIFAFVFCVAWAPIVDRFRLTSLGRRRSWIGLTQLLTAVLIATLAAIDAGSDSVWLVFAVCAAIATVAATQRIAVLGFMAETLKPNERGFGATAAGIGAAVGHLIGGAFALFLIEQVGWHTALTAFAVFTAICGLIVLLIGEPEASDVQESSQGISWSILKQSRVWFVLLFIAPAAIGLAAAYAMSEPRLVDLGFGLSQVGLIAGIANLMTFSLIGPLVSVLIREQAPEIALVGVFLISAIAFAVSLAIGYADPAIGGILGIVVVFAAFSAQHVAVTSLFMALSRSRSAGTDLTTLVAAQSLMAMPGFIASGFLASAAGHQAPISAAAAGSLISAALLLWRGKQLADFQPSRQDTSAIVDSR